MFDHTHKQNHEDLGCLQDHISAVMNDTPEENWCQAARRRLQSSLDSAREEGWVMTPIKTKLQGKLGWAVAVAALAITAILVGIIPKIGETGLAFAQVVQRIQQIQTLTFQVAATQPAPGLQHLRWLYKAPHRWRCEFVDTGSLWIIDKHKSLRCLSERKIYYYDEDYDPHLEFNLLNRIAEIKAATVETLPEKELAGHRVAGFKAPFTKDPSEMATIWADAKTGDPVQVEFKHADGDTHVWSDFQVNVPLDDALFSLTPPEGYTCQGRLFHQAR